MEPRHAQRLALITCNLVLLLSLPDVAAAVDGVIEINQASAKSGGVVPFDEPLFPVKIIQPGSYRLTSNLDVTDATARPAGVGAADATAIQILVDNVTIDLNGFTIIGPTTCTPSNDSGTDCTSTGQGKGITGISGTTVINGTIKGMGAHGVETVGSGHIERVNINNCGGTAVGVGTGSIVRSCVIRQNGGTGILLTSKGLVADNVVMFNDGFALNAGEGSGYTGNVFNTNNQGDANPQVNGGVQIPTGSNICGGDAVCP